MKIIEQKIELIEQGENLVSHVARCARVCYKREKGNDEVTYNNLLKNKHWSMFRHATYYYIIPDNYEPDWVKELFKLIRMYKFVIAGIDVGKDLYYYYIVINGNWALDHPNWCQQIREFKVDSKEFANAGENAWNMMRYTFKVTTQISTSRELNRVSPNNIAEQSTRYVYGDCTLCRPHWMTDKDVEIINKYNGDIIDLTYIAEANSKIFHYASECQSSFNTYKYLIDEEKLSRQDARGVLPLDTATEVIYTYSIPEWRHIIELRADAKHAHPNAVIIANMIKEKLNELGYDL